MALDDAQGAARSGGAGAGMATGILAGTIAAPAAVATAPAPAVPPRGRGRWRPAGSLSRSMALGAECRLRRDRRNSRRSSSRTGRICRKSIGLIGDGDHGINMAKGFGRAADAHRRTGLPPLDQALSVLSDILLSEIGGSMGPLYGFMFRKEQRSPWADEPRSTPSIFRPC